MFKSSTSVYRRFPVLAISFRGFIYLEVFIGMMHSLSSFLQVPTPNSWELRFCYCCSGSSYIMFQEHTLMAKPNVKHFKLTQLCCEFLDKCSMLVLHGSVVITATRHAVSNGFLKKRSVEL